MNSFSGQRLCKCPWCRTVVRFGECVVFDEFYQRLLKNDRAKVDNFKHLLAYALRAPDIKGDYDRLIETIFEKDPEWQIDEWLLEFSRINGHPAEDALSRHFFDRIKFPDDFEALSFAIKTKNTENIKKLLANGATFVKDNQNLLFSAINDNDETLVKLFVENGAADINRIDPVHEMNAVHYAIMKTRYEILKYFLEGGKMNFACKSRENISSTAFYYDMIVDNFDKFKNYFNESEVPVLKFSIDKPVKSSEELACNFFGKNSELLDLNKLLVLAICQGSSVEIVELLLNTIKNNHSDWDQMLSTYSKTLLPFIARYELNYEDNVKVLFKFGVKFNHLSRCEAEKIFYWSTSISKSKIYKTRKYDIYHNITFALLNQNTKIFDSEIVPSHFDLNKLSKFRDLFYRRSADNLNGPYKDFVPSAFLKAVRYGHIKDFAKMLENDKADLNIKDARNWNVLHYIADADRNQMEMLKLLFENPSAKYKQQIKEIINAEVFNIGSPLTVAISKALITGNYQALQFLIASGAKIDPSAFISHFRNVLRRNNLDGRIRLFQDIVDFLPPEYDFLDLLNLAVLHSNVAKIFEIVLKRMDELKLEWNKEMFLELAAKMNNLEAVKIFLNQGANIKSFSETQVKELFSQCLIESRPVEPVKFEVCYALLENFTCFDQNDYERALFFAVKYDDDQKVAILALKHNARLNFYLDSSKIDILYFAVIYNRTSVFKAIIETGKANLTDKDIFRNNILHFLVLPQNQEMLKWLVSLNSSAIKIQIKKIVNEKNREGLSPVELALRNRNYESVKLLLSTGAQLTVLDFPLEFEVLRIINSNDSDYSTIREVIQMIKDDEECLKMVLGLFKRNDNFVQDALHELHYENPLV